MSFCDFFISPQPIYGAPILTPTGGYISRLPTPIPITRRREPWEDRDFLQLIKQYLELKTQRNR